MSSAGQSLLSPTYELKAGPPYRFDLDRREFFKFLGAGILVVFDSETDLPGRRNPGERGEAGEHFPGSTLGCILGKTATSRSIPERLKSDRTFAPP